MTVLRLILHVFAYLFHLAAALFLAGVCLVGWISGSRNFELFLIPWWSGREVIHIGLGAALTGLLTLVLALKGRMRFLFGLYTVVAFAVIVRAFLLGDYEYESLDHFKSVMLYPAGALLAMLGGLSQMRRR